MTARHYFGKFWIPAAIAVLFDYCFFLFLILPFLPTPRSKMVVVPRKYLPCLMDMEDPKWPGFVNLGTCRKRECVVMVVVAASFSPTFFCFRTSFALFVLH
jgi:hypothetical protein